MTGVRHERTGKAAEGSGYQGDLARELTEEGVVFARTRRRLLGSTQYTRVGCSPILRARQTAMLIGGLDDERKLVLIPGLGIDDPASGDDAYRVDELFNAHGYDPLRTYREADDTGAIDRYGENAWRDVQAFLRSPAAQEERNLLVGHAVLLCAAFLPAVQHEPAMADALLDLKLVPGGGFRIIFHDGIAKDFEVFNDAV